MADEVINEIWEIKEAIARENQYNIDVLITNLKNQEKNENLKRVNLRNQKRKKQS